MAEVGDTVTVLRAFRVFRISGSSLDICDIDGNCLTVSEKEIHLQNKTIIMKAMKDATLAVATTLAKANNTVTTLEIKNELRRDYPYYFWTQDIVSKYMDQLAGDGVFTYTDNGTFRTYKLVSKKANGKSAPLSKSITITAGKGTSNNVSNSASQTATGVKVQKTKIDWQRVVQLASNPQFVAVTLFNGQTVSKQTIRSQKKSPAGYINPKLGRIKSITVGNTQYNVK